MKRAHSWLVAALIAAIAVVGLEVSPKRRDVTEARAALRERPDVQVLNATKMPDTFGTKTYWLKMQRFDGGALALGRRANSIGLSLLVMNPRGEGLVQSQIAGHSCTTTDLLTIQQDRAIVACGEDGVLGFFGIEFDGTQLKTSDLLASTQWGPCPMPCKVFGATHEESHFWVVPTQNGRWAIGAGRGLARPIFAPLVGPADVSGVSAFTDDAILVVSVERDTEIQLSVVSEHGQISKQVTVSKSDASLSFAKPQVVFDGSEITVLWIQQVPEARWPFSSTTSRLVFQKFDSSLRAVGSTKYVSEDRQIGPFFSQKLQSGIVVEWDQGVRGPWNVASLVRYNATMVGSSHSVLRRIPGGQMPVSTAETDAGLLLLLPASGSSLHPYQTILIDLN